MYGEVRQSGIQAGQGREDQSIGDEIGADCFKTKEAGESSLASGVGMWCVGVLRYRETSRNKSRNIQDESRNIGIG